jgi:hypothetical protein
MVKIWLVHTFDVARLLQKIRPDPSGVKPYVS